MTRALEGRNPLPAALLILILIVALAAYLRLHNLVPIERGLQFLQDYDEGVWDSSAQLMLQGHLPYRDFFATLPPVAIYLLAGLLRLIDTPWGSAVGFMVTRYASVGYGLATVAAVCLLGHKLAGWPAGLAAAALLALDGMVVGMDRRVMLEPPLNLCSVLAVLAYCHAFERTQDDTKGQQAAILSGLLSAVAALAKTPGIVVVLAVLTVSLLRLRLREAAVIAVSCAVGWAVLSAYFLIRCSDEFLKQVYFFQLLRPADGVTRWATRLYDMWHYESAWLTVRAGLAGTLLLSLFAITRPEARHWLAVLAWMGYTFGLIVVNKSYWPQYYVQLAVPLSLLGGALFDTRVGPAWSFRNAAGRVPWPTMQSLFFLVVVLVGLIGGQLAGQWMHTMRALEETSPVYTEVAGFLSDNTQPQASILTFEPNYTFLASRPPAGAQHGRFLVDSYGEMLYLNLGIQERSLLALAKAVLTREQSDLQPTFWRTPAQEQVLTAFEQAQYVIVDGRARYQLHPSTLAAIQARSSEVFAAGSATVRVRHVESAYTASPNPVGGQRHD